MRLGHRLSGRERILSETLRQRGNCLVTKKQFGRRFIKRREECIDSQVTSRLHFCKKMKAFAPRLIVMCWSSPITRISYQPVCLLHRGYRVDVQFLPECNGAGSSPRPFVHPITPASGADGGSATGTLELPPLCLRTTCG